MITQLLISSSGKPIITANYIIVGGGGGAVIGGANGLGGTVINGSTIIPVGSHSITVGAGGSRGGGLGNSSSFIGLIASGSTRTTTVVLDGETFSGRDQGPPGSSIKGSGALASAITAYYQCSFEPGLFTDPDDCSRFGGSWIVGGYSNGNGNNGVVILTIPTALISSITTTNASVSTSGTNTIYRYNSSGSLVVS